MNGPCLRTRYIATKHYQTQNSCSQSTRFLQCRHYVVSDVTMFMSWVPVARYLSVKDSLSSAGMAFRIAQSLVFGLSVQCAEAEYWMNRRPFSESLFVARCVKVAACNYMKSHAATLSRVRVARQNRIYVTSALVFKQCVSYTACRLKDELPYTWIPRFASHTCCMNICLFPIKLQILVKICPIVIEILTFNKWS